MSRKATKAIVAFFTLSAILAVVLFLVTKFVPVPDPQLRILAAEYPTPPIPFNAFASRDSKLIAAQSSVLDSSRANAAPLDFETMQKETNSLAEIRTSVNWFSWEKATALVYVNAAGVVLPGENELPIPYVLANNFEVPTRRDAALNAVRVTDVIDSILKCNADWKVVVLDCQRFDHFWPLGVLRNDFVKETLAILEAKYSGREDLFVLFSCSPGQVSWVDAAAGQSVFAHAFARALYEDARRDRDSKVTLGELVETVTENVLSWCGQNRADRQDPLLFPKGQDVERVQLIAKMDSDQFVALENSTAEQALLADPPEELQKVWMSYYGLVASRPYLEYPEKWRELEERLLHAEKYWLGGGLESTRNEIARAAAIAGELSATPANPTARGSSLPMDGFVGGNSVEFAEIVKGVVGGGLDLATATNRLFGASLSGRQRPIEAHLVALIEQTIQDAKAGPTSPLVQKAKSIVQLQQQAEQACVPADDRVFAHLVHRWTRPLIERADQYRRLYVDRLLAEGGARMQIGKLTADLDSDQLVAQGFRSDDDQTTTDQLRSRADEWYSEAISHGQAIARAYRVQCRMLAELPYLAQLLAVRAWEQEDKKFRDQYEEPIERLLEQSVELSRLLRSNPPADRPALAAQVKQIDSLSKSISPVADAVQDLLAKRLGELGSSTDQPDNQPIWHQLDYVLHLPIAANPSNAELSARTRINALKRVRQNVAGEGGGKSSAVVSTNPTPRSTDQELATFALQLYGSGTGDDPRQAGPLNELAPVKVGDLVATLWRKAYQLAIPGRAVETAPADISQLAQATDALRVTNGVFSGPSGGSPRTRLRALGRADFFAWHGLRCITEYWNRALRDESEEPYYRRAALEYDKLAAQEDAPTSKLAEQLKSELKQKRELPGLMVQPSALRLRGPDDEQSLRISLTDPQKFPTFGLGAVRLGAHEAIVERSPRKQPDAWSVAYSLGMKPISGKAPRPQIDGVLSFRGHRLPRSIAATLIDDETGDTVLYSNELKENPRIEIQLAKDPAAFPRILFVLDCSLSMESEADNGRTRMEIMKDVLRQFAESAQGTGIHVGVRLLGRNVRMDQKALDNLSVEQQAPYFEKASLDSNLVLEVGRFDREKFLAVVNDLQPMGATPLFHAEAEAAGDLRNVPGREKRVVVVSDGEDYFYDEKNQFRPRPVADGYRLVEKAYSGTNIEIHAIGYFVEGNGLEQLQTVTKKHNGTTEVASNSQQLLEKIMGLGGYYRFTAENGQTTQPRVLRETVDAIAVPQGRYNLAVRDARDRGADQINSVRLEVGQVHSLIFTPPRTLDYAERDFAVRRAYADSKDGQFALRVLAADKDGQGNVQLTFSVFKKGYPKDDANWRPPFVSAHVRTPEDFAQRRHYAFHNLPPNSRGHHLPKWTIRLEDWPSDCNDAVIEVRWSDKDDYVERLQIANARQANVGAGIRITHCEYYEQDDSLKVKIHFAEGAEGDFHAWSLRFSEPAQVATSRQIYNAAEKVYTGVFTFRQDQRPKEMSLHRPRQDAGLSVGFRIGAAKQ